MTHSPPTTAVSSLSPVAYCLWPASDCPLSPDGITKSASQLTIDYRVGHPAKIRAAEPRKQKNDRRDACLILTLLAENRFPAIWMPSREQRDLQILLRHRHQFVRIRTRVQQTLEGTVFPFQTFLVRPSLTAYLNFAWVWPDKLAGCRSPRSTGDISKLRELGIRAVVRLELFTVSTESLRTADIDHCPEPVTDFKAPTQDQIDRMARFALRAIAQRKRLPRHVVRVMAGRQRCWHVRSSRVEVALKNHFKRLHGAIATDILRRLNKRKPFTCLLIDWQRTKISAVR
jgi:Transposase